MSYIRRIEPHDDRLTPAQSIVVIGALSLLSWALLCTLLKWIIDA